MPGNYLSPGPPEPGTVPSPSSTLFDTASISSSASVPQTPVSGESSNMFSRRCSIETPSLGSRGRSPDSSHDSVGATKRIKSSENGASDEEDIKKEEKNTKECTKRAILRGDLQDLEDMLGSTCGIELERLEAQQNKSNSIASGLKITKHEVQEKACAILAYLIDKNLKDAILQGDKEIHYHEMRKVVLSEDQYPGKGTVMDYSSISRCAHNEKEAACIVHDHPNFIECRKSRKEIITDMKIQGLEADFKRLQIGDN